jgi:hypothetical protein
MACDPAAVLAGASCYLACVPPGLTPYAEIALLCAIRDGDTLVCGDTGALISAASCLECAIPIGMTPYVRLGLLCEILNAL